MESMLDSVSKQFGVEKKDDETDSPAQQNSVPLDGSAGRTHPSAADMSVHSNVSSTKSFNTHTGAPLKPNEKQKNNTANKPKNLTNVNTKNLPHLISQLPSHSPPITRSNSPTMGERTDRSIMSERTDRSIRPDPSIRSERTDRSDKSYKTTDSKISSQNKRHATTNTSPQRGYPIGGTVPRPRKVVGEGKPKGLITTATKHLLTTGTGTRSEMSIDSRSSPVDSGYSEPVTPTSYEPMTPTITALSSARSSREKITIMTDGTSSTNTITNMTAKSVPTNTNNVNKDGEEVKKARWSVSGRKKPKVKSKYADLMDRARYNPLSQGGKGKGIKGSFHVPPRSCKTAPEATRYNNSNHSQSVSMHHHPRPAFESSSIAAESSMASSNMGASSASYFAFRSQTTKHHLQSISFHIHTPFYIIHSLTSLHFTSAAAREVEASP